MFAYTVTIGRNSRVIAVFHPKTRDREMTRRAILEWVVFWLIVLATFALIALGDWYTRLVHRTITTSEGTEP